MCHNKYIGIMAAMAMMSAGSLPYSQPIPTYQPKQDPPTLKGCKKFFFTGAGELCTESDAYIFSCIALSEKHARKKFEKRFGKWERM